MVCGFYIPFAHEALADQYFTPLLWSITLLRSFPEKLPPRNDTFNGGERLLSKLQWKILIWKWWTLGVKRCWEPKKVGFCSEFPVNIEIQPNHVIKQDIWVSICSYSYLPGHVLDHNSGTRLASWDADRKALRIGGAIGLAFWIAVHQIVLVDYISTWPPNYSLLLEAFFWSLINKPLA